jgi:hypothetical protein
MEKRSTTADSDAERAFQKLVKTLTASDASIEAPRPTRREFGSNALKVNGKIFAMLVRGGAHHFRCRRPVRRGKGKPMKEWVTIPAVEKSWLALAREARLFVGH